MNQIILVIFLFVGCTSQEGSTQEGSGRVPVYIPGKCPKNQLFYPGVKETDWVCDCGPGYIYYLTADDCFLPYRQGPCEVKEILVLGKDNSTSECVANPCQNDGFIKYQGECYELNTQGPCKSPQEQKFVVNKITLELECVSKEGEPLHVIDFPPNCPKGGKQTCTREKFD